MNPVESFTVDRDEVFLDGPVNSRLAVLDFNPTTNRLRKGARFVHRAASSRADTRSPTRTPSSRRTSCRSASSRQRCGRCRCSRSRTRWAARSSGRSAPRSSSSCRAPGEWENAFYERESHSLQFFHFPSKSPTNALTTVYTSLSHDIVSHECGHAILDGIAPDLYNALTPQSLASTRRSRTTALVMAFRSPTVRETVLSQTNGSIRDSTAFTRLAEEFGPALDPGGGSSTCATSQRPQARRRERRRDRAARPQRGADGRALHRDGEAPRAAEAPADEGRGGDRVLGLRQGALRRGRAVPADGLPCARLPPARRDLLRGLRPRDHRLRPSGASGGRTGRKWLCREFVRRRIVRDLEELHVPMPRVSRALAGVDLQTLFDSDWAAYDFANRNRRLLGIPPEIPFDVRPRLKGRSARTTAAASAATWSSACSRSPGRAGEHRAGAGSRTSGRSRPGRRSRSSGASRPGSSAQG